ncbi:MAG: leucine-rich repeat protein [Eubacteriales bacterium]|nr:leucine-rich repeat protein [Eubacteriales bacterium]
MTKNIIKTTMLLLLTMFMGVSCKDDKADELSIVSIGLNLEEITLGAGETKQLIAVVNPTHLTDKTVSWDSEDISIATVDQDGLVTAISPGETKIYVRSEKVVNYCKVTVSDRVVAVESVTLNESELNLEKDDIFTLIATVNPSDASDKTLMWESSDPSAVSVDNNGNIVALKAGVSTNITAKAGGKMAICVVNVKSEVLDYPENSYQLSEDGKELVKWHGTEEHIDMNIDSKLREVEIIKLAAFESNLTVKSIKLGEKVAYLESYAFVGAENLASVTFPSNIKSIGAFTFSSTGLQSLVLPEGLTNIGSGAFKATKITSVVIPQSVESYGADVFHSCGELVSATLPNSVTRLEGGAFARCLKLETIKLGNAINFFEEWSFTECSSLKTVEIATAVPTPIESNVFWGVTLSGVTLKVPAGAANTYKATAVWSDFGKIEEVSF